MLRRFITLLLIFLCPAVSAAEPTLLFSDDFSRDEAKPGKEDIGNGWTNNRLM